MGSCKRLFEIEQIYNDLVFVAKSRDIKKKTKGTEIHHIKPKCLGGSDDEENLVVLTFKEHFIAHKLLTKIYPKVDKVWYAVHRMSNNGKYKFGSYYSYARIHHQKIVSNWSLSYMKGKTAARDSVTGKNVILSVDEFKSNPERYCGVAKGRTYKCDIKKGYSVYVNIEGDKKYLHNSDPRVISFEYRGINSSRDISYLTVAAKEKMLNTPWYKNPKTNKDIIKYSFLLYDWYSDEYDPIRPKATGLAKFYKKYSLPKSKTLGKLFVDFNEGYSPYNDIGLKEYVEKNI